MQDIPTPNDPSSLLFKAGVDSRPWALPEQRLLSAPISIEKDLHAITQGIHSNDSFLQVKVLGNLQILLKAHSMEKFEEFLIRVGPRLIELLNSGTVGTSTWILMILPNITKSEFCKESGKLGLLRSLKKLAENSNPHVSRFICQTLLGMVQSTKAGELVSEIIEIGLLPWITEMATSPSEFVSRYALQLLAAIFSFSEHDSRDVLTVMASMASLLRTERWETCVRVFSVLPGLMANLPTSSLPECHHLILSIVNTLIKIPSNMLPHIEQISLDILCIWTGEICVDALARSPLGKLLLRALLRLVITFEADFFTLGHYPSNATFLRVCSHLALSTTMAQILVNSGILDVLNDILLNVHVLEELHDEIGSFCMYLCSSLEIRQMSTIMNKWPAILSGGIQYACHSEEEGNQISLVQFDCLSRVLNVIKQVPNWPTYMYPQISNLIQVLDTYSYNSIQEVENCQPGYIPRYE